MHPSTGEVAPGEYVAGWAKRGPTGRIGNNKPRVKLTSVPEMLEVLQRGRE